MAVVKENKKGEETMTLGINLERMLPAQSWASTLDFDVFSQSTGAYVAAVAAAKSVV